MKNIFTVLLTLLSFSLYAQEITVTGKVTSTDDPEGVIGASILVPGTTNGTITDLDGNYTLNVPSNATLRFSMTGYKTQEIRVNGQTVINVVLQEDTQMLDEVVVVGYGVVKKSDLTSSISTVKGEELQYMTSGNAMQSLQGKTPGVQVTSGGGPGDQPRVIIRGVTTVNGTNPLYVVDGMPVGENINFLNQNDIESMEVLKDASAAAIYGTRGSNGVILITTKKGKVGKPTFNVTTSVGFQTLKNPNMAGAAEYEQVFKARYINDGDTPRWNSPMEGYTDADGTDWWKETVNKTALIQNYNISFQGGDEKIVYSGNVGYYKQNSQYDYGFWDKLTARFSSEYKFSNYIKAGIDMMPKLERWKDTPDLLSAAMYMDPTTPIFRPEEEWTSNEYDNYQRSYNNETWNPVASLARQNKGTDEYGLLMNPYISIEPISGLTIRSQFGVNARFNHTDEFTPEFNMHAQEQSLVNKAYRKMNHYVDWNWTNTVNYMTTFNSKHNLNVMAGYTAEKFSYYWLEGSRTNIPSNNLEELWYVSAGTDGRDASGTNTYNTLISYLGRVMYNYDNRYYVTASVRVDGSSKFAEGNKYATFPAVSAAWRISEEAFMKENQDVVNSLKLRLGWGRVGNQNIDSDAYLSLLTTTNYVFNGDRVTGTALEGVANPALQWETVEDYNIGLDMGFLNNRLNVTADFFRKESKDMLLNKQNLLILGYPSWNGQLWTNVGSMTATGWEVAINWHDKAGDFTYDLGLNLSSVKNKAKRLVDGDAIKTQDFNGDQIVWNVEGGEIARFWGYKTDGIFQNWTEVYAHSDENGNLLQPNAQPGDIRFKDLNGDGVFDENDKTWIGKALPDLTVGFNVQIGYKNFDLVANFYGTFGNDIYNKTKTGYSGEGGSNVYAGTLDKVWTGEGTSNDFPRLSVNDPNMNYKRVSDFFVESGSYFRCKLLQVGYTIPRHLLNGYGLRVSLSAQNPFTITKYSGMDPERGSMGGDNITEAGVDGIAYPNPRTFLLGLNFTF